MARARVVVVADTPSPHQNCYFDAIARRGEIDLRVLFCRALMPEREVWKGVRPTRARYQILSEGSVRGLPTNPGLIPTLLGDPDRLPFMIGYYLPGMLMGCLTLGTLRRPWVFWTDTLPDPGSTRSHLGGFARRFCLERATSCLTTGAAGRRALDAHGVPPERVFDIPFVVDADAIASGVDRSWTDRESLRRSLGVAPDGRLLLFIGQMIRRKGIDLLLDAVADLRAERSAAPLHLALVGEGDDLAAFREQATRLGLSPFVSFVPAVKNDELPRYWAAADALILPSYFDPWPVVVVEALTAGLPVLGSDACGSVRDRVIDGKTGWIFPAGERTGLTACLRRVASLPHEMLVAMRVTARSSMRRYSPDARAAAFTHVVDDTLRRAAQASGISGRRLRRRFVPSTPRARLASGAR